MKSLKLGEKNLTLNILSYQLPGVKLLKVFIYIYIYAKMTQRKTYLAIVGVHWHHMYILVCGLDKALAPLLESETWLDRKCPSVSDGTCSVAPTSLLLASWTNPTLTQGNLPFLASLEQFSPADRCSLGVSNEIPYSDWPCLSYKPEKKKIAVRHPASSQERVGSGKREIRGQPTYISQLPASSHTSLVIPCLESNSQVFTLCPGVLPCVFH